MSMRRFLLVLLLACFGATAPASAKDGAVQTSWRLLDYIAVDYSGAVSGSGQIVNSGEYSEMREFSASVEQQFAALPDKPAKPDLISGARRLRAAIEAKAPPAAVSGLARSLNGELLRAYPVPLGPRRVPNLARGAELFRRDCASCHGATGDAKTPMAAALDPPPIAFTDRARAVERTPFALYQVIDQGLEGTAMGSFANLPAQDKWDLAYYSSSLAHSSELVSEGRRLWESAPGIRSDVPDLEALSGLSERALAERVGADRAAALIAFLRTNPEAVSGQASSLSVARERLKQSLAAYEAGDRDGARSLALSAYLDGFEPVEPVLTARDGELMARVEEGMATLRSMIASGQPIEAVRAQVAEVNALFDEVELALSPDSGTAVSAFLGGFTILLREGLEALLIVIAMLAFLRKAERPELARPVHYGWAGALAAGGLTWWAATSLIGISGASRELTEGFGSLLAAVVLLFVGIWMHGKAQAGQWQRYIREKMSRAVSGRSAWFLFALAFIAVYREVFETILFYAAMAAQGHTGALIGGGLVAAVLLAAIAVAMLRFSRRLPIAKFFSYSSALVAVLAIILAGKGVAALQEAGLLGIHPLPGMPRISMLGLFPTAQSLAAQVLSLLVLLVGFSWNRRSAVAAAA